MTADDHLIYAQAKYMVEAAVAEGTAAALQEQVSGDSQSAHPKNYSFFTPARSKNQDQDGTLCQSSFLSHIV
jgi:hypothetical protein